MKITVMYFFTLIHVAFLTLFAQAYSGGSGTDADPYQLATKADLLYLGTNTADYGSHFIMTADIDLAGEVFDRAVIAPDTDSSLSGFQGDNFKGFFNGNDYSIINLTIDSSMERRDYLGLFGLINDLESVVSNLFIVQANIIGADGAENVGGLCGQQYAGLIYGCICSGSVSSGVDSVYVGGLCGNNSFDPSVIRKSGFSGTVTSGAGSWHTGGVCGWNEDLVTECYAEGSVSSPGGFCVGGVCGSVYLGSVSSSFSTCSVSGYERVGGVCGYINISSVYSTYSSGAVTGELYVGGVVGYGAFMDSIDECYSVAIVKGRLYVGGIYGDPQDISTSSCYYYYWSSPMSNVGTSLTQEELMERSSYQGFDFADTLVDGNRETWIITPGSLPKLSWQIGNDPSLPLFDAPVSSLEGLGSEDSPYLVYNYDDFMEFCSNDTLDRGHYKLMANIDLGQTNFTRSVIDRTFGGVFDGGGYVITNLTIDTKGAKVDNLGLFSIVSGVVKKIGVTDIFVDGGVNSDYVGGACGYIHNGLLAECFTDGSISGGDGVGGVCGRVYPGTVSNSYSHAEVYAVYAGGGFCGINSSSDIYACYSTGLVNGLYDIGGFCGENFSGATLSCFWDVESSGYTTSAGGIGRTTLELQTESTFIDAGWDFAHHWYMRDYPALDCFYLAAGFYALTVENGAGSGINSPGDVISIFADPDSEGVVFSGWSVEPGVYSNAVSNSKDPDTYLIMPAAEITVKANYIVDVTAIEVAGVNTVYAMTTNQYLSFVHYINGDVIDATCVVDWSMDPVLPQISLSNGVMVVADIDYNTQVVVRASYSENGIVHSTGRVVNVQYQLYSGGLGTVDDPYQVATKADLLYLGTNTADYSSYFIMTADIDLEGEVFDRAVIAPDTESLSYGYQGNKFAGSFDGNAHIIRNLTIDGLASGGDYFGLFGYVESSSGYVRKLGLVNFSISGGVDSDNVGGICGRNDGLMEECYSKGDICAGEKSGSLGLLCGHNSGTIENCYSLGSVFGGDESWSLGGLFGRNENGFIKDCYSAAFVRGYSSIGGLCGSTTGGSVSSCFWDVDKSGLMNSGGGIGLANAEMEKPEMFLEAGWDFVNEISNGTNNVWKMAGYPVLNWQNGYALSVTDGDGDGVYNESETVAVVFNKGCGHEFRSWIVEPIEYTNNFEDIFSPVTTFMFPATNVIMSAVYDSYSGGTGTKIDPYHIANIEDLIGVSSSPNDYDKYFLLQADIDLMGVSFVNAVIASDTYSYASGFQGRAFRGYFNGGGHIIKNVSIKAGGSGNDYLGLFGFISGSSVITDLGVAGVDIVGGTDSDFIGGLCGYNAGGEFVSCYAEGKIESGYAGESLGGLCGYNKSGAINQCYSAVDINGDKNIGGLCGYNNAGVINECYAIGNICGGDYSGGFCGMNSSGAVSNCYAVGSVAGITGVGGFCGRNDSGVIDRAYSTGSVSGSGETGAFCGNNTGVDNMCYCNYWAGLEKGFATALSDVEMLISDAYVGFDFAEDFKDGTNDIWSICAGYLPKLRWQNDNGYRLRHYETPLTSLSGQGTSVSPFMINTLEDFQEFYTNEDLNKGYYQLNTDIDLSGTIFSTAVINHDFSGVFDGKGHTVYNVSFNSTGSNIGLFSTVYTEIKNLTVENITVDGGAGSDYLGGLCACNHGIIRDCFVEKSVITGCSFLGGICGYNYGTVIDCYAEACISGYSSSSSYSLGGVCGSNVGYVNGCDVVCNISGDRCLGGVCGFNSGIISFCNAVGTVIDSINFAQDLGGLCGNNNDDGVIEKCTSHVDVSSDGYRIGGLCGQNAGSIKSCRVSGNIIGCRWVGGLCGANGGEIINSCSEGGVSSADNFSYPGNYSFYGGFCGYNCGLLERCYSTGDVTISEQVNAEYLGGLCGSNEEGIIRDCYALGSVSTGDYVGGVCGYSEGDEISRCYSAGFVDGTDKVGGFCGENVYYHSIKACFWDMDAAEISSSDGGIGKTTADMQSQSTFDGYYAWDFVGETVNGTNDIWVMDDYPKLNYKNDFKYNGGSGTEIDPYLICSKLDFLNFCTNTADYSFHYILLTDIDLNGCIFEKSLIAPDIGAFSYGYQGIPFTGGFDGNGYIIKNMTVNTAGAGTDYLGLFGRIAGTNTYIRNLSLLNVSINGSLASDFVGGICGCSEYGHFHNCHVSGEILGGDYIGGLCGYNSADSDQCSADVSVSGADNVGGMFGWNAYGCLTDSYVHGAVSGCSNVGGFVGRDKQGDYSKCYSANSVNGSTSVGGFCGYSYAGYYNSCFWDKEFSGVSESAGAIGMSTADMMNQTTFESVEWDFSSLWFMNGYPVFGWTGSVLSVFNGSGSGWYEQGEHLTVIADPEAEGFAFVNWHVSPVKYVENLTDPLNPESSFVMPGTNVTLTAVYSEMQHVLDVVDGSGSGTYGVGSVVEIRADAIDGYVFSHWLVEPANHIVNLDDPSSVSTVFTMSSTNITLTAKYDCYSGGLGTPGNPFVISTKSDLLSLGNNTRDYAGCFVLASDIDLSTESFPASLIAADKSSVGGFQGTPFSGVFDGCGHVISNLVIDTHNLGNPYLGLFGKISGTSAVVKNIDLVALSISDDWDSDFIGGVCGYNAGGSLSRCSASGVVNCGDYSNYIGLLCGYNNGGTLHSCYTAGSVKGRDYLGGLCGWNNGNIYNCSSMGNLYGWYVIGGLSGRNYYGSICESFSSVNIEGGVQRFGGFCGECYGGSISNCYSQGDVDGGDCHYYYGGFCGALDSGVISRCYSTGSINQGEGSFLYIGGFCGWRSGGAIIDCFWDKEISNKLFNDGAGGTGKTTAEMQTESTFVDAGWDFVDVWGMVEYPELRCFHESGTYDYWLMDAGIPVSLRGESDSPAADNIPNLLKYACGLPAMDACTTADLMTIEPVASDTFSILYYKSKTAEDVTLRPIWAENLLSSWSTLGVTIEKLGEDAEREQWKASVPLGESGFIKLRAMQE